MFDKDKLKVTRFFNLTLNFQASKSTLFSCSGLPPSSTQLSSTVNFSTIRFNVVATDALEKFQQQNLISPSTLLSGTTSMAMETIRLRRWCLLTLPWKFCQRISTFGSKTSPNLPSRILQSFRTSTAKCLKIFKTWPAFMLLILR